jgi:hypothetical protein
VLELQRQCSSGLGKEGEAVLKQRVALRIFAAIFSGILLVLKGELIWAANQGAQIPDAAKTPPNLATSTGQSGDVMAGTLNIRHQHRADNREIIRRLEILVDRGTTIAKAWEATNDTNSLKRDIGPWVEAVDNYLSNNLGVNRAIRFKNTHEGSPIPLDPHSPEGTAPWHEILGKVHFLKRLINELRK